MAVSRIPIVLLDPSWTWQGAIAHHIAASRHFVLLGAVGDVRSAVDLVDEHRPALFIVEPDLGAESGFQAARIVSARHPGTRVVLLAARPTPEAVAEARRLRLAAFVAKADLESRDAFLRTLVRVHGGERVYSDGATLVESAAALYALTAREQALVACFADGLGTDEIAKKLFLGPQTVRNYTRNIGVKLGASGRLGIVATAIRVGLIEPPGRAVR